MAQTVLTFFIARTRMTLSKAKPATIRSMVARAKTDCSAAKTIGDAGHTPYFIILAVGWHYYLV